MQNTFLLRLLIHLRLIVVWMRVLTKEIKTGLRFLSWTWVEFYLLQTLATQIILKEIVFIHIL